MARRSREVVSYNMSQIKATGSAIERLMASFLWKVGLRGYRKHSSTIIGKPDFAWNKYRVAVFCDSSFWHGYNWGKSSKEAFKVRKKFWINKIESNIRRDREVSKELKRQGWVVLRFWDHQIKSNPDKCAFKVKGELRKRSE